MSESSALELFSSDFIAIDGYELSLTMFVFALTNRNLDMNLHRTSL